MVIVALGEPRVPVTSGVSAAATPAANEPATKADSKNRRLGNFDFKRMQRIVFLLIVFSRRDQSRRRRSEGLETKASTHDE
jgi:hypothetical protein